MATTDFKSVNEYIAAQPKAAQVVLRRVRTVIRQAIPGAEEVISYQIPAFRVTGRIVLFLAAWTHHYSLYPADDELIAAFKGALAPYRASKGTLRFPLSDPVPAALIARVAKFRARAVARRAKEQQARRQKGR